MITKEKRLPLPRKDLKQGKSMLKNTLFWVLFGLAASGPVMAEQDALRDGHPYRYTVQVGDTLWDIAGRFLREPWFWPEIWHENPDIENPHLIYPGDVVVLSMVDGEPSLSVERGGGTVKLSPEVRTSDLDEAIPTIPASAIRPFLEQTRVVSADAFESAPYIVAGADERVLGASGDPIYVRGTPSDPPRGWDVLRRGSAFIDPETDELLGYEATQVATARLDSEGDPATFTLTSSNREVAPGDRLFVVEDSELRSRFQPRIPETSIGGVIMAVMDGVSQIGQYDVVALNRGAADGLEVGHVMDVYRRGRVIEDRYSGDREAVRLPDEKAGQLIVFRTFEQLSFALIMEGTRAMAVHDIVRTP